MGETMRRTFFWVTPGQFERSVARLNGLRVKRGAKNPATTTQLSRGTLQLANQRPATSAAAYRSSSWPLRSPEPSESEVRFLPYVIACRQPLPSLRTTPVPSTHPTHPAAQLILTTLREAQRGYADMPGNWSVKCLEGRGKRLVARVETVNPLVTGREFGEWVELILGTKDEEFSLLQELSPLPSAALMASAFGMLLTSILTFFNAILAAPVVLVKKSLHWNTFLSLSVFEGLLSLQNHWDDLLSCRGPDIMTDKNEL
ncbi:uncharacterized protein LACBIDRAFT_325913 [Laccaria bicolor S238N-H82]|uniref:Predicted protein n=1 Tax=Laccaria bicolor (strain S238N-H82 / ATCC MYA-4686) TaxID=486041 RepID=B0D6N2_LACBS|nr:uncharacterized protein LACBIDRAFT_325913 [Laccaria bicolor S238N-H82]EDR10217.1 predicted protein [Laccaria bicolor S238N-H82]|eukprot:XP_001879602.1 predicted protein [Laccaria bicolor S238N-H82]